MSCGIKTTMVGAEILLFTLLIGGCASSGDDDSSVDELPLMLEVPGGSFAMGCPGGEAGRACAGGTTQICETPLHEVRLSPFWLDRTEVTVDAYARCVDDGACNEPAVDFTAWDKVNWNAPGRGLHPMNAVTWADALAYCSWRGARLPTEAEWEMAARGTDQRYYPWGDSPPSCDRAWGSDVEEETDGCGTGITSAVGDLPAGAGPFGHLDLIGNVLEWCSDWFDCNYYDYSPEEDPQGAEEPTPPPPDWDDDDEPVPYDTKVVRGGEFTLGFRATSARRYSAYASEGPNAHIGFRCARSEQPGED